MISLCSLLTWESGNESSQTMLPRDKTQLVEKNLVFIFSLGICCCCCFLKFHQLSKLVSDASNYLTDFIQMASLGF